MLLFELDKYIKQQIYIFALFSVILPEIKKEKLMATARLQLTIKYDLLKTLQSKSGNGNI